MGKQSDKTKEYYTILTQNALKGETYLIKFRNESIIYSGIPVLRSNLNTENEDNFSFRVTEPREKAGVYTKSIKDIELLEKR
ncbi:MAG: hypothetical protein WAN36_02745 [Calditrichia bacterium]